MIRGCWLTIAVLLFGSFSHGAAPRPAVTNEWLLVTGAYSDTTPAIAPDRTVYFGTWHGELWSITPAGKKKWTLRAGKDIASSPAIGADGTIYFGGRDRKFYAVNPNGTKKWEFATGGWVDSSPALGTNGVIYFGGWDKTFYALGPNGQRLWDFKTDGEIVSSPVVNLDGTIYFGSHDGKVYALSPEGKQQWVVQTGGAIVASPGFDGPDKLIIPSTDGYLYALQTANGKLLWRLRTGGITESSPVVGSDHTIYVGVNQGLWAISPDGKKKWDHWDESLVEVAPTVFADGSIGYVTKWGLVVDLHPDRTTIWSFYVYGFGKGNFSVGPGGQLFCDFASLDFTALNTRVPLGKTPWPCWRANSRNTGNLADVGQ